MFIKDSEKKFITECYMKGCNYNENNFVTMLVLQLTLYIILTVDVV